MIEYCVLLGFYRGYVREWDKVVNWWEILGFIEC